MGEPKRNTKKLNFALLALFAFALASIGFANTNMKANTSGTVMDKTGTAFAATQIQAGFNTAITQTGATLAPDENTGFVLTNTGDNQNLAFNEATRFKDAAITGTPSDNFRLVANTQKNGTATTFTVAQKFALASPPDEVIMTAANAQTANNWMKIQTTARGSSGTTDEVGMADNAEAANAHDGTVAAGYTAGFAGFRINANFNTNHLACAGFQV